LSEQFDKNALEQIRARSARGERMVFTNGCFDILHSGHVQYLQQARSLGDFLVVGLNGDDSVSRLKGPGRPINPAEDRKLVLEALRSVDFVVVFNADTPLELIKSVRPSILVKGGDWKVGEIIGGDFVTSYGGDVKSLLLVPGRSTTSVIERSKNSASDTSKSPT
jgi:D-glycero-beta-D-manno-heptose 1-phosphate adenylyltransferase